MSFPRYPEYKDSGIEWLGEVPAHWRQARLKQVVVPSRPITYGIVQAGENVPDGVPYIRPIDMSEDEGVKELSDLLRTSREIASAYKRSSLDAGDLVCSIGPSFGKTMVVPPALAGANLTQGTARIAISPEQITRYFFWILRSQNSRDQWESSIGGATFRALNLGPLSETYVPIPPREEQAKIAAFLDHETARIDDLIEEQRRLIELLKEKRQAVISHAVTKGLDPNVPMKDSGEEWLGEVPAHWVVAKVAYHYEVVLGKMLDERRITGKHLAPYLRNTDVQWDRISLEDLPLMDFSPTDRKKYELKKGDLLVCEGGEVGRAAIWESQNTECYYQKALHRMRPLHKNSEAPRFMFYLLWHASEQGRFTSTEGKSTIAHLPAETLRQYRFPFPPIGEQEEIVSYLDRKNQQMNLLVEETEHAIQLLSERRSALISAAVTGKIDIRNWQSNSPFSASERPKVAEHAGHYTANEATP